MVETLGGRDLAELADNLRRFIRDHYSDKEAADIEQALSWMLEAHDGQYRKGELQTPYAVHPIRVASLLFETTDGPVGSEAVITSLLHDILEDSDKKSVDDITSAFGPIVSGMVQSLTAPSRTDIPDKAERNRAKAEQAARGGAMVRHIKLCDRIDNMRDTANIANVEGAAFRERYQQESMLLYLPMAEASGNERLLAAFNGALGVLREQVLRDELQPGKCAANRIVLDARRMFAPINLDTRYARQVEAAFDEMKRLEKGEIVNTAENWQTGHYWLRESPETPAEYRSVIQEAIDAIDEFYADEFLGRFSSILWIGIGGSALGPQMLNDALREPGKTPTMYFFDNTDPDGFERVFAEIRAADGLKNTLTVVVSKSGGTKETRNGMLNAKAAYESDKLVFEDHAVAITKPKSKLSQIASGEAPVNAASQPAKWLQQFPIWDFVGGRTSMFSPVGLLPAKLLGLDMQAFLDGAKSMDAWTAPTARDNPAMTMALLWYHAVEHLGLRNMVVLPYFDRLLLMSRYLQQLLMESLGKQCKGITVFGNKGSTDQHSFVQQLRDGYRDFFVTFLNVHGGERRKDSAFDLEVEDGLNAADYLAAFQIGTEQALCDTGRLSMSLTLCNGLNERSLGALIALFERAVGYYGPMIGVNAYHQPGVEAGKAAADDAIAAQRAITSLLAHTDLQQSPKEIGAKLGLSPLLVEAILDRLAR